MLQNVNASPKWILVDEISFYLPKKSNCLDFIHSLNAVILHLLKLRSLLIVIALAWICQMSLKNCLRNWLVKEVLNSKTKPYVGWWYVSLDKTWHCWFLRIVIISFQCFTFQDCSSSEWTKMKLTLCSLLWPWININGDFI